MAGNPIQVMGMLAQVAGSNPREGAKLFARTGRRPRDLFPEMAQDGGEGREGEGGRDMANGTSGGQQGLPTIPGVTPLTGPQGSAPGAGMDQDALAQLIQAAGTVQPPQPQAQPFAQPSPVGPPAARTGNLGGGQNLQLIQQLLGGGMPQNTAPTLGQLLGSGGGG